MSSFIDYDDDDEEEESFLASYSDLVTDLMAIFVLLFAFAMVSQGTGRGETENRNDSNDSTQIHADNSDYQEKSELYNALSEYIEENDMANRLSVNINGNGIVLLRIFDSALFESGSADVTPAAEEILLDISEIFTRYGNLIENVHIEGHTDNIPIHTDRFESNWELSSSRSHSVLNYFLSGGSIEPHKIKAVGLGEFHPIADNATAEGRRQNRRVDFIIEEAEEGGLLDVLNVTIEEPVDNQGYYEENL